MNHGHSDSLYLGPKLSALLFDQYLSSSSINTRSRPRLAAKGYCCDSGTEGWLESVGLWVGWLVGL